MSKKSDGDTSEANANRGRTSSKPGKLVSINQAAPVGGMMSVAGTKMMETLAARFEPEQLCLLLEDLLNAETPPIIDKAGNVHVRPDNTTRLRALEFVFAYIVGHPIERQQIRHAKAPASLDDLVERAEKSPVFAQSLMALLERITKPKREGEG